MFTVQEISFGPLVQFELKNTQTGEYFRCIPAYGCTLNALYLQNNGVLYDVIEGSTDYETLIGEGTDAWKGQFLFPFPNRIKNGRYLHEGKMYQFNLNDTEGRPNALHGLAQKANFHVIHKEATATHAQLTVVWATDGKHPAYPFEIQAENTFTLNAQGVTVSTCIKNVGTKNAPFGVGWHPYFKLNALINDLDLQLPLHKIISVDADLIPNGKHTDAFTFLSPEPIEDTALDTAYLFLPTTEDRIIQLINPVSQVMLQITLPVVDTPYEYLQIYTPPHRQYIAVEPQTCAPNAFNNGLGLQIIAPEEQKIHSFHLQLKGIAESPLPL